MITKAVLLCGGLATRLLPITKSVPKEMLPILNRPAIDYCIEDLKANGITDILIVLGRNKECIENYYDRNIELEDRLKRENKIAELESITSMHKDINITFIRQKEAKGTGYATKLAQRFVGADSFILLYPDELIIGDSLCRQLLKAYKDLRSNIIPLQHINISECHKYGMVGLESGTQKITHFVEKPDIDHAPSNICYIGGGILKSGIFKHLDNLPFINGEQRLTDAFPYLIEENNLYGITIVGQRIDIGTPLGYLKSNILSGLNNKDISGELYSFIKSIK